jgi:polar amino acid transport system substrate-binding protein/glutamate/aspartate transport system substrate-binding protein
MAAINTMWALGESKSETASPDHLSHRRRLMPTVTRSLLAAAVAASLLVASSASAGTLDDIQASGTIRIAYREDAAPFSFKKSGADTPAGFMLDLCRSVSAKIGEQMGVHDLKVVYVPVTSADRFDAINDNKAGLLCEATTQTLKRRELVSFSIPTFVDGASFIIGIGGPRDLRGLAGKKVGVLVNTTTEADLKRALQAASINADVIAVKTHGEATGASRPLFDALWQAAGLPEF